MVVTGSINMVSFLVKNGLVLSPHLMGSLGIFRVQQVLAVKRPSSIYHFFLKKTPYTLVFKARYTSIPRLWLFTDNIGSQPLGLYYVV